MLALFTFLIFGSVDSSHAHGENMPGPHKGSIRMPGTFHTEAILQSDGVQIYLLDMSFEKPSIIDSQVTAVLTFDKKALELECQKKRDHFFCPIKKVPKDALLTVRATREKIKGEDAIYPIKNGKF